MSGPSRPGAPAREDEVGLHAHILLLVAHFQDREDRDGQRNNVLALVLGALARQGPTIAVDLAPAHPADLLAALPREHRDSDDPGEQVPVLGLGRLGPVPDPAHLVERQNPLAASLGARLLDPAGRIGRDELPMQRPAE
jgi:hypothetical protein